MKKGLLISLIITVIVGGGLFFSYTGANNKEIKLRKNVEAQQDVCKSNFDKMFKTIAKMAQVPTKFMEDAKSTALTAPFFIITISSFIFSISTNF